MPCFIFWKILNPNIENIYIITLICKHTNMKQYRFQELYSEQTSKPCNWAFKEKKTTVNAGPYIVCPIAIFFNVESKSRFGKSFDMKLNQKCSDGPKISSPYPAIRDVLARS